MKHCGCGWRILLRRTWPEGAPGRNLALQPPFQTAPLDPFAGVHCTRPGLTEARHACREHKLDQKLISVGMSADAARTSASATVLQRSAHGPAAHPSG